ncbi:DUF6114 domain-containing protein [Streptomyces sp. NPDC005722]
MLLTPLWKRVRRSGIAPLSAPALSAVRLRARHLIDQLSWRHIRGRVAAARIRGRFGTWRGRRPFWAGLVTFGAGLPILYWPYANLDLGSVPLSLSTTSGAGSLLIGVLLIVLGLSLWYQPHHRTFAGIATLLLAVISLPVANFGGLLLGMLAGLVGGCLACSWSPPVVVAEPPEPACPFTVAEPPTASEPRSGPDDPSAPEVAFSTAG